MGSFCGMGWDECDGMGGVWSPVIPRYERIPAGSVSDGHRPKGRVRFNNEPFPTSSSSPPPLDPFPVLPFFEKEIKENVTTGDYGFLYTS